MDARKVDDAVVWTSGLEVDADGAPRAYHPDSKSGLDNLTNAGRPGNWWALVCDSSGKPIVQGSGDPAPGFYVSTTALADRSRQRRDPRRYVDSSSVPYVSIPPELSALGVRVGDVCWVVSGERSCAAVVADVGPRGKLGEGSIALVAALGGDPDARRGGIGRGVSFVVFPGSTRGWPRSNADVQNQAWTLFSSWGGACKLVDALKVPE